MAGLTVNQFDGGMTDYWVDGPPNCGKLFENLLVTFDKKITSRPGSAIFSTTYAQTALGTQRIGKVFEFNGVIFLCQGARLYYFVDGAGWTELKGAGGSDYTFAGVAGYANYYAVAKWNNHLLLTDDTLSTPVRKAYKNSGGTWKVFSAGLPAVNFESASYPTLAAASVGSTYRYVYAFHYFREYTLDGSVVHQEVGPVTLQSVTSAAVISGGNAVTIDPASASNIWPAPATTGNHFYDTSNLYVKIYRTEANQDVPMLVTSIAVSTNSTYSDTTADASLGEEIYTAGDVLEYDPPPYAKYVVVVNDIAWYGNVVESGVTKPMRVRQSLQSGVDKCPASLFTDVDGDVTGMGAVGNLPLVFCADKFYRLEGYVDNLGTGFVRKVVVSDTVGCISHDSILQSKDGVCFAAEDGFYFTDGYVCQKVSRNLSKETYKRYTTAGATVTEALRRKRITGSFDKASNRYWWAVQDDDDSTDNDSCIIFDASQGIKEDGCFTTAVGGSNYAPTCLAFVSGDLYRGDRRGYLFLHEDDLLNDPVVDTGVAVTSWGTAVVEYDYQSCAFSLGGIDRTKYVTRLTVASSSTTNLSMQPQGANNTRNDWDDLKEIRYRGGILWGDEDVIWGDEDVVWNQSGSLLSERRFPRTSLRCIYKQVRFKNSTTVIARSDDSEVATIASTANTATLATDTWPEDVVGYSLVISYDDYAEEFPITARTSTELTLTDTYGHLPDGSYAWEIWGKRRSERVLLDSYVISYEEAGNTLQGYKTTSSGHNA